MACGDRAPVILRSRWRILIAGAVLALVAGPAVAAGITQVTDLSADASKANARDLPLLLVVTREDCGFCARLKRNVIVPMILSGEYETRVIIRELNIDAGTRLVDFDGGSVSPLTVAIRYDALFTPTVLLVGPQGQDLDERLIGINNDEMYLFYLDQAIDRAAARIGDGIR